MSKIGAFWPSINTSCQSLVENLVKAAQLLRIKVNRLDNGTRIVDAGIEVPGGMEAGRRIGEICMGGLGTVRLGAHSGFEAWPWALHVHTAAPVLSCLGSQYAGWSLSHKGEDGNQFHALGSGPGRALAGQEELFQILGYHDQAEATCLVLEVSQPPPEIIADEIATACKIRPQNLTLILTPTTSLAGVVQIAGRILEVAMHKIHALNFPLDQVVDGYGVSPVAPPGGDFMTAMARTNDAILLGGQVHLFVACDDEEACALAEAMPSATSRDYGRPFAEIFKSCGYDFFQIDPLLFSPAKVIVTSVRSSKSFTAGNLNAPLLAKAFKLPL
jgi:methenyltetrahydromethanopterin cyclohydrolase